MGLYENDINRLVIYGAGDFGTALKNILEKADVSVGCFVQSDTPAKKMQDGIPIYAYSDFIQNHQAGEQIFLLAIDCEKVVFDIRQQLIETGIEEQRIWDMRGFIKENKARLSANKVCCLCRKTVNVFQPWGLKDFFFEDNMVFNGGYRENVLCPHCGSSDRNRFVFYIIKSRTNMLSLGCRVLHFAPEPQLMKELQKHQNIDYYPADLQGSGQVHEINVTKLPFQDNTFEYIIINHVLEHVKDEKAAIEELKRVIKPEGVIILSFPVSLNHLTQEANEELTEKERIKQFGQSDHVRLYGYDCVERLEKYGLCIQRYTPKEILPQKLVCRYGFIADDIVFFATKEGK